MFATNQIEVKNLQNQVGRHSQTYVALSPELFIGSATVKIYCYIRHFDVADSHVLPDNIM